MGYHRYDFDPDDPFDPGIDLVATQSTQAETRYVVDANWQLKLPTLEEGFGVSAPRVTFLAGVRARF